jgi:hypothetical protein
MGSLPNHQNEGYGLDLEKAKILGLSINITGGGVCQRGVLPHLNSEEFCSPRGCYHGWGDGVEIG